MTTDAPTALSVEQAAELARSSPDPHQRTFIGLVEGRFAAEAWVGHLIVNMTERKAPR